MKHTLKKLSDTQVSLSITVDKAELELAKKTTLKHLAPQVKVSGFRPGKVPADVAEKNLDPSLLATETAEHAINTALNEAAIKEQLRILDRPQIELKDYKPYESLSFDATIEILPEITLGDYTKLKATREATDVTDADVDTVIERMRGGFGEKREVERAAQDGDEVVIDFEGTDEKGAPIDGASAKDYSLTLGSNTFIPGFEEGLVGHKAGEEFELPLVFPKDYHAESLKGAKVTFKVTLKAVHEVVLPEVTDEFAAKCGPFKTVEELKADVTRELEAQNQRSADEKYKDDLIGALVEVSTIPIPALLVDDQMKSLERDAMQNLMYQGMTVDQYVASRGYKDQDEWREKEFRPAAERRVQAGLALSELSKAENIEVTTEELNARHDELLQQYPTMKDQLDAPEARRDLANRVITEKTVDRLVELNS